MIARIVMATGLTTLGVFQAGLALGRPWGAASYGGAHSGVLPGHLRLSSAVAAPVYLDVTAAVGTGSRAGLGGAGHCHGGGHHSQCPLPRPCGEGMGAGVCSYRVGGVERKASSMTAVSPDS